MPGLKPDYHIENFCRHCKICYPKDIIRCTECHFLLRTRPGASINRQKYLEVKVRT